MSFGMIYGFHYPLNETREPLRNHCTRISFGMIYGFYYPLNETREPIRNQCTRIPRVAIGDIWELQKHPELCYN